MLNSIYEEKQNNPEKWELAKKLAKESLNYLPRDNYISLDELEELEFKALLSDD